MVDYIDKELKERMDLVDEISRAKFEMLRIAISGLIAIKEQGHPIAKKTLDEMANAIPKELELDIYKQISDILNNDGE